MESKPREPAQVTALLLNKCRQQQSLQRTICQHVYAIKVYNYGDDSQKKRKVSEPIRESKKACSAITQNSHGGDWLIVLGLKSTKDSEHDPV